MDLPATSVSDVSRRLQTIIFNLYSILEQIGTGEVFSQVWGVSGEWRKKVPSPHSPLCREIRFAPFFIDGGNLGRNTGVKSTILSSEYFARTKTQNILAPIRTERENIYFAQKIFITVEQSGECDLDMRRDSCFSNGSHNMALL